MMPKIARDHKSAIGGVKRICSRLVVRATHGTDDSATATGWGAVPGGWHALASKTGRALTTAYRDCRQRLAQAVEIWRQAEMAQRDRAMRASRRAQRRALVLLLGQLNPQQREEFRRHHYFHVVGASTGTIYRIRAGTIANIDVLSSDGRVRHRLCVQPIGEVPLYDVMAAQVLYLQDPQAEQRLLRQAVIHYRSAMTEIRGVSDMP